MPSWVPATPAGRRRVLQRYEQAQQRRAAKLQPYRDKKRLSKKERQAVKNRKLVSRRLAG